MADNSSEQIEYDNLKERVNSLEKMWRTLKAESGSREAHADFGACGIDATTVRDLMNRMEARAGITIPA